MSNSLELSIFKVIHGARGSDKTLMMTHFIIEALQKAFWVNLLRERYPKAAERFKRIKTTVYANYPVLAYWDVPLAGVGTVKLQSKLIDWPRLLVWDEMYSDCWINIDEIDTVADRQNWYNTFSQMIVSGTKLIRHRNISINASLQFNDELNARLQKQADVLIKARDLHMTPWGKSEGLKGGEVANTTWLDKSGLLTGYTYLESRRSYERRFFGKRYWWAYDTHHEVDLIAARTKYELRVPKVIIDATGDDDEGDRADFELINETLMQYAAEGNRTKIKAEEFWQRCQDKGLKGNKSLLGKYLTEIGVQRKVYQGRARYNIEALV